MSRFRPSISWNTSNQSNPSTTGHGEQTHKASQTASEPWNELLDGSKVSFDSPYAYDSGDSDACGHSNTGGPYDKFDSSDALAYRSLRHVLFVPMHYEKNYAYPLIVWLHNNGFNENQVDHVMPHISMRNFVGAGVRGNRAADSLGHRFDWHHSPSAIAAAHESVIQTIEDASEQFSIHPRRIVLAGYHAGGTMAMRVAMREPDRFAAVISLGGHLPSGQRTLGNLAMLRRRRLPMLWQWASESERLSHESLDRDIRSAMLMRSEVEIRQYSGDDEMNTVVLADLNEWVMSRVVSAERGSTSRRWATSPTAFSSN